MGAHPHHFMTGAIAIIYTILLGVCIWGALRSLLPILFQKKHDLDNANKPQEHSKPE